MSLNKWSNQKKLNIDQRDAGEIEHQIKLLADSYTPGWHFDVENPDVGSTIGILFAKQMEENIGRLNQVIDKYHTEFVNMLDISPLPAKPSCAVVLMDMGQDTVAGVPVVKGTKLLADVDSSNQQIVFETAHNLYATSSRMDDIFMTNGSNGKIIPLKGDFESQKIVEEISEASDSVEEGNEESNDTRLQLAPFRLFDKEAKGIEKNALLFYHPTVFDVVGDDVYVKILNGKQLIQKIAMQKYRFWYYSEEGLIPVETVLSGEAEDTFLLRMSKKSKKLEWKNTKYSLLALIAEEPVTQSIKVDDIEFSSAGKEKPAEFVNNGNTDFEVESFHLFGDTLSLYSECYIGENTYFSKAGALIKISFDTSYFETTVKNTFVQEQDDLKIIKRKPKVIWSDTSADAYAEEISIEYFNGIGWKKLECQQEYRGMFQSEKKGRYQLDFICPSDWQESSVGAFLGRCLRIQLLKSDNCYMRPCIHHYPHLEKLAISYSYEQKYVKPSRLISIAGTKKLDLTKYLREDKGYCAFTKSEYDENSLYLGFHQRMEEGPVSIFFLLEDGIRYEETICKFEYSTGNGFKQMKVLDHTDNMSKSGIVLFIPPVDMNVQQIEGKRRFWIKISQNRQKDSEQTVRPRILNIYMNAVEVYNIETKEEEDFYIDEISPNMVFPLGERNILNADVWVNEKGRISETMIKNFQREKPDSIRVEEDTLGEITAVFIKWDEVEQFGADTGKRVYVLDRMNNQLLFGDGIHTEIPRITDDISYKMVIRCCNGTEGNVAPAKIVNTLGSLLFVEQIYNPLKAFGGSNMESVESVMERGANIISARRRLVSMKDYDREILAYSDNIDKVKCILETDTEKNQENVNFVLLLKDFASGSYSFHNMAGNLKQFLMESCELTISSDNLHIVEPVFVSISVDIWAKINNMDDSFEIQTSLQECLEEYLNPVSDVSGNGWEIGKLPQKSQIMMKLGVLQNKVVVKKMAVTATYTDEKGQHEVNLDELERTPYMVCNSGNHHVHIMLHSTL